MMMIKKSSSSEVKSLPKMGKKRSEQSYDFILAEYPQGPHYIRNDRKDYSY